MTLLLSNESDQVVWNALITMRGQGYYSGLLLPRTHKGSIIDLGELLHADYLDFSCKSAPDEKMIPHGRDHKIRLLLGEKTALKKSPVVIEITFVENELLLRVRE